MNLLVNRHDWDLMNNICEDFESNSTNSKHISIKELAADYADVIPHHNISKAELRMLIAKIRKLKNSSKKEERAKGIRLAKQIQGAFNIS